MSSRLRSGLAAMAHELGPAILSLLVLATWATAAAPAARARESLRDSAELGPPIVVDDFEDVSGWKPFPADGVDLKIESGEGFQGRALRLDFHFEGGGYAVAHKDVDLDLPENYEFSFRIRGEAPSNSLEFKLIDDTGQNVWWCVRRDVQFPKQWQTFVIKKRHISFAWGPAGGGEIHHVAAIEFSITAGSGGTGTVWIDQLTLTPLPPPGTPLPPPSATASSSQQNSGPMASLDGDAATFWAPDKHDREPTLQVDFGGSYEFSAVSLRWAADAFATDYDVEVSADGAHWDTLRQVRDGNGGRDDLYLPESEARFLRLRLLRRGKGIPQLAELKVRPLDWATTQEAFYEKLAHRAPRGSYPRGISGEQSYWTVVGQDDDPQEVLFDEDGALETGKRSFRVEPFVYLAKDGRVPASLVTWADGTHRHSLLDDCLPIPTTQWDAARVQLTIQAFAVGPPGASSIVATYQLSNITRQRLRGKLFLALRPFQVNPPAQFLNTPGGCAPLHTLRRDGPMVVGNEQHAVVALTQLSGFGALTYDQGNLVDDFLRQGSLPSAHSVDDPQQAASGAFAFDFDLKPGASRLAAIEIPLSTPGTTGGVTVPQQAQAWLGAQLDAARDAWRRRIAGADTTGMQIDVPPAGQRLLGTLRSQLGFILVNRAGPAIQPGTRAYARSWIRDGSLTSSALLRVGMNGPAREFLEWYAPYQYPSGKAPCVVDSRGADPTPEHDSSGELIFLIAEVYRYTHDTQLARRMWPHVQAAASYLDSLRQLRRTTDWLDTSKGEFYGLLPPSISHEGYSAKPMHSYWDDFFALKGFADAAYLAGELQLSEQQKKWTAVRDEFGGDLRASVEAAMRAHDIDYVPGCADLGDFDATSTTIALSPTHAADLLPDEALRNTFERYWQFFVDRRDSDTWDAYTPYELRTVGAFVRLGWRDRAQQLLQWFLQYQRPAGWNSWAEVVERKDRAPRFLGDMPHTWVGSDFVRSVLDMFAYEREADQALVIAAGIPQVWLTGAGVSVKRLPTPWGPLSYTMALGVGGDAVELQVDAGLTLPPGGIVVLPPVQVEAQRLTMLPGPPGSAAAVLPPEVVNGEIHIRSLPMRLRITDANAR